MLFDGILPGCEIKMVFVVYWFKPEARFLFFRGDVLWREIKADDLKAHQEYYRRFTRIAALEAVFSKGEIRVKGRTEDKVFNLYELRDKELIRRRTEEDPTYQHSKTVW